VIDSNAHPEVFVIQAKDLTKRYGSTVAVDGVSFEVRPGQVTGFLGPNGAGKSTTMRMIVGLDRPTSGSVRVNGQPYVQLKRPMREVGALLDAGSTHGGRTAFHHLLSIAQSNNLPRWRVDEVLDLVGLASVAGQRTAGFSLGMGQRLGLAAALLGDPAVLVLDEPVNGLDPEGILWIRNLLRSLADEGRTVFVSSHLMSEMQATADRLLVIAQGRVLADCTIGEFIDRHSALQTRVRVADAVAASTLATLVARAGGRVADADGGSADGELLLRGLEPAAIGDLAFEHGLRLHELSPVTASLEEAFLELTKDAVEYVAIDPPAPVSPPAVSGGRR
jgi:ABC-2 type transport system ATP-binding protein